MQTSAYISAGLSVDAVLLIRIFTFRILSLLHACGINDLLVVWVASHVCARTNDGACVVRVCMFVFLHLSASTSL
jgi:hypothetical protein